MNKQFRKNIFKVIIFLVIPFGVIISFLWRPNETKEYSTSLEISTEPMQSIREINQDALEGFEIFSMMRESSIEYALFSSNEPKGAFSFDVLEDITRSFEILTLDVPQDTIYIIFENFLAEAEIADSSPVRDTFILKLFYNYEVIAFRPLNQTYFDTEFLFSLSEGYQVHIPITLSEELELNDYLNNLTIAIFGTPERHTVDLEAMFWHRFEHGDQYSYYLNDWGNGIVQNFTITYDGNLPQTLHGVYHDVKALESINIYQPLNIVHEIGELNEFNEIAVSMVTSSPLRASPNEELELVFSSSLGSSHYKIESEREEAVKLENYLIIVLLDWEQIEINGLPYLLVDVTDDFMRYETRQGNFRIQAPAEPGFYDFVAFAIPNLVNPPLSELYSPLSFRFTIEVEYQ